MLPPAIAVHARPRRPRPAVCASAASACRWMSCRSARRESSLFVESIASTTSSVSFAPPRAATIASRCNVSMREEGATGSLRESRLRLLLEYATPDLVQLDRLEERPEVTLAEALVALALDDLEEDRSDDGGRENLQQHLVGRGRTV